MILYSEGATKAQEDEANGILEALTIAYPGYPWWVRVYDGGFFIRNLLFDGNWGMNFKGKHASASEMKRDLILKAGEFLERANLRRGRNNDDPIVRIEGVPEKYQPAEYREKKFVENIAVVQGEIRTTPHPQVIEQQKEDHDGFQKTSG